MRGGLPRGGARLARLAAARRGRRPRRAADHVRRRRASGASTSGRSTGCPATRARSRCASATPPPASSSSTSTARSCRRCTRRTRMGDPPTALDLGPADVRWSTSSRPAGSEPDDGIWEVRGPRRHFTHSKVMAWVAVDRAVQTIEQLPGIDGPARALARAARRRSTPRSATRASTPRSAPSPSTTAPTPSTPACS